MTRQLTNLLRRSPAGFGLGQVPARLKPDAVTSMVCGFCSTGCSLDVHLRDGGPSTSSRRTSYPVNLGVACPKGWESLAPLTAPDRATRRCCATDTAGSSRSTGRRRSATFTERFKAIQAEHGPESVAFLSTGQIPTEEMALLGAVAKFGMGLVHGDGNTRQCMATSVVAYKEAFGFDAPPYTYADFEASDVIVLVGSNLCIAHPIMWERIMRNPHRPRDRRRRSPRAPRRRWPPRSTSPLRPKSDLVLLYGLAHLLIERGVDRPRLRRRAHHGLRRLRARTSTASRPTRGEATGVPLDAARARSPTPSHDGERVSFWWTMGVNQSHQAVRTAQALINLALMTGNIGRPGTGANSITGQCNAMGSRLFSNTTSLLGGHDFTDAERPRARSPTSSASTRPHPRPAEPGLRPDHRGHRRGKIHGLWVDRHQPAHSWINQADVHELLDRLDFLVVQDLYATTETRQRADLVLPAAGWGEKEGTFINSERRLGMVEAGHARRPAQALADFYIFKAVADGVGLRRPVRRLDRSRGDVPDPARLTGGPALRLYGRRGLRRTSTRAAVQWPYPAVASPDERPVWCSARRRRADPTQRRLFADGRFFHPDGRARFLFEEPEVPLEVPSAALSARAAHRPRVSQPVAHRDPHREVGDPAGPRP